MTRFGGTLCSVAAVVALWTAAPSPVSADGAIEHVITYGQSLSTGEAALPPLSTVPVPGSLMFNGGVRTSYVVQDRASIYARLVPLVESADGHLGETPTAGALQMIHELRRAEDGASSAQRSVRYLGSAPGFGGLTLAQLNADTLPFLVLAENVLYGAARARELGSSYRVGAIHWAQGESDEVVGTTREAYVAGMKVLKRRVDLHAAQLSGNPAPVPIIQHQVSSHVATGSRHPRIALAQMELADTVDGFYVATPSYMMDFVDGLHLTAASSKWLGAYFGLVYKRVVIDRKDWKPLSPLRVTAKGSVVRATFRVPHPPLVLDTERVVDPGDHGFSLVSAKGNTIGIRSVRLSSPDTVTIASIRGIPPGARLRYGFKGTAASGSRAGPRGNLRDSQGDTLVFDPDGIRKRMDNWCVIFEAAVTGSQ